MRINQGPPSRAEVQTPPERMKTFQVTSPRTTHTRPGSCEEAECDQYLRGWAMRIDLQTPLGQKQAHYIKHSSGRRYVIADQRDGLVTLHFAPNQPCFQEHRVPTGRPEIYRVKGGDHRGNPLRTPVRTHTKAEFWLEEFQENQDRLKTQIERG